MHNSPYITALGDLVGQDLKLDTNGLLAITLDGVPLLFHWQEHAQAFLLHMDIGRPTTYGGGKIFSLLLGANFLLSETKGAAISFNKYSGIASLECLLFVHGLDSSQFLTRVEHFVAQVDRWKEQLAAWNTEIEEQISMVLDSLNVDMDTDGTAETAPNLANMSSAETNFGSMLRV